MTTILHLGVVDVPYASANGTTTGQVAQWLEKKYGVMGAFARVKKTDIQAAVVNSFRGAISNAAMGHNGGPPLAAATDDIGQMFRDFLTTSEIETLGIDGVPTQAALKGLSNRFKGKRNKGKGGKGIGVRRPSFIDTGLYQKSFRAWVD